MVLHFHIPVHRYSYPVSTTKSQYILKALRHRYAATRQIVLIYKEQTEETFLKRKLVTGRCFTQFSVSKEKRKIQQEKLRKAYRGWILGEL
jgi:hypothetical protein